MTEPRTQAPGYPVRLEIDYPEDGLSRVTTAFRLILTILIAVIAALLTTSATDRTVEGVDPWLAGWAFGLTTGGYLVVPVLLMILVRGSIPCGGSTGTSSWRASRAASTPTWRCSVTSTPPPTNRRPSIWRSTTPTRHGIFGFLVGVLRWALRVHAYVFLLTTDRYPPFSLDL